MPEALRPLLGIQLAPAVVGGVTWTSINAGITDLFAQILLSYGLYQALLLIRLLPWICQAILRAGLLGLQFWCCRVADVGNQAGS
jgi:tellurite resistance protein